ncbi:MAG TPA: hypothetical protein VG206_13910 [Terriglobia bacterium]|nr:hypothetical protein [Terriglobia bacterium]
MPSSKQLQATIDEQADTLDQVNTLVDEALDPELSREELVAKVKEIQELLPETEEAEEEPEED